MVDDDLAVRHGDVERVLLLGDVRVRVEDLEDAVGGRAGLLGDRDDVGDHPHRCEELREVRGEREEGAERDLTLDREITTECEHTDLTVRRDGREERRELSLDTEVAYGGVTE